MEKKCKIVQTKADFCKKKTLRRTRKVFPLCLRRHYAPMLKSKATTANVKTGFVISNLFNFFSVICIFNRNYC